MRPSAMIAAWLPAAVEVDAHAIAMSCSAFYDGSKVGAAGIGSFLLDAATSQFTDFAGMLTVQQVPEPASLVLIGLGVLGLALVCRRRRVPSPPSMQQKR